MDLTITVPQAANIIGCRNQYVRDLIHQGQLPATKTPHGWKLDPGPVTNYARRHKARLDPNLIDARQAATLIGTSPAIILRWARNGRLPIAHQRRDHPNLGRPKYLFRPEDVHAARDHQRKPLHSPPATG